MGAFSISSSTIHYLCPRNSLCFKTKFTYRPIFSEAKLSRMLAIGRATQKNSGDELQLVSEDLFVPEFV